jgi:hypothetical protein
MWAARNQVFSGRWLRCITVPAVTEVWRPQSAHCQVARLRFRGHPWQPPHAGHVKPFGHLRRARYSAHASSFGNRASKACLDRGRRSFFQRAGIPSWKRNSRLQSSRAGYHMMYDRT